MNFTQSNITINETGSTSLHCNATGNPTPTIQWWRIRNGSAQHVLDGETLELRHVRRNESGDYRCTASNGVGNPAVSHVNLNVQCKFCKFYNSNVLRIMIGGQRVLIGSLSFF